MSRSVLGGAMLVAGTAIGAGMLALPLDVGLNGFGLSTLIMIGVFVFMLATLFLLLEASLRYPNEESHIISLSHHYLGPMAKAASWLCFMVVLYAACTAYLTASGDIINHFASLSGANQWLESIISFMTPSDVYIIIFFIAFSSIIYFKPEWLDQFNLILMICLIYSFVLMSISALSQAKMSHLMQMPEDGHYVMKSIPIVLLAFTSHIILPTMRQYIRNDIKALIRILFIGSLIPLICYLVWNGIILSVVPLDQMRDIVINPNIDGSAFKSFIHLLTQKTNDVLDIVIQFFMFMALATSFLGASLSLTDFLKDGLHRYIPKENHRTYLALTYLPPLVIALVYSQFTAILKLGGVMLTLLYGVFPIFMVWQARYRQQTTSPYVFPGGKPVLVLMMILALGLLIIPTYQLLAPMIGITL